MKTIKNNNYIPSPRLSLLSLFLVLGTLGGILSCDDLDDTPPPSAYVPPTPVPEPEPGEPCEFGTIVPDLVIGVDFECGAPEITTFEENEGSLELEFVENPDSSGINTSEKVVKYTQTAGVRPWAGFFFNLPGKIDFSVLQTIKIKVYSPAADQIVVLKLEDAADGSIAKEVQAITTVADQWEELSFAFSPSDSDKFNNLVLFFDFNGPKDATTIHYFDDIVMAEGGGDIEEPADPGVPSAAAPAPTVNPLEVISLFSGAYTNVAVDTWRTEWSDAILEDIDIASDAVKKYSALGFVGIETIASPIDLTDMTHFHVDIWTGDATAFNVKLVDLGADGVFGGGDDVEHEIVIENPTQQEWVSLDIPLSDFAGLTTKANIAQIIFVGAPSKQNTVYVDNVYFYNEAGISTQPISAAPEPTTAESNVISVFSDAYTNVAGTDFNPNWGQATVMTQESVAGNNTLKYAGLNYQGTAFATPIDASAMTMIHVDYWTADSSALNLSLISDGPKEIPYAFTLTTGEWVSVDIPLSEFSGVVDLTDVIQLKFDGNGTIYLDNIYFY